MVTIRSIVIFTQFFSLCNLWYLSHAYSYFNFILFLFMLVIILSHTYGYNIFTDFFFLCVSYCLSKKIWPIFILTCYINWGQDFLDRLAMTKKYVKTIYFKLMLMVIYIVLFLFLFCFLDWGKWQLQRNIFNDEKCSGSGSRYYWLIIELSHTRPLRKNGSDPTFSKTRIRIRLSKTH